LGAGFAAIGFEAGAATLPVAILVGAGGVVVAIAAGMFTSLFVCAGVVVYVALTRPELLSDAEDVPSD